MLHGTRLDHLRSEKQSASNSSRDREIWLCRRSIFFQCFTSFDSIVGDIFPSNRVMICNYATSCQLLRTVQIQAKFACYFYSFQRTFLHLFKPLQYSCETVTAHVSIRSRRTRDVTSYAQVTAQFYFLIQRPGCMIYLFIYLLHDLFLRWVCLLSAEQMFILFPYQVQYKRNHDDTTEMQI